MVKYTMDLRLRMFHYNVRVVRGDFRGGGIEVVVAEYHA